MKPYRLEKTIPARKKVWEGDWLFKQFSTYGEEWKRGRSHSPIDACQWCGAAFKDGDVIALLGAIPHKLNKAICQACAAAAAAPPSRPQCVKDVVDSLEEADEGPTCCRCGTPVSENADSMVVHGRLAYYCGECLAGMREAADDARRDI